MNTTSPIPHDQHEDLARHAAIDALLREDGAHWRSGHVDNDDFSARVMAQVRTIPAPRVLSRRRFMVVGVAGFVGAAVVVFFGGGANLMIDATMDLATRTVTPAVLSLAVVALATAALGVMAATER